ncbi:MAG: hypothetical protein L5655_01230 [Thermosediminibacteraceae bacterium]|nr:hypothetical protein [Thermosediminibacteraceae bacterium]
MDMYIDDLIALFLVFVVVLALGLRMAEEGVYSIMGLDTDPLTFDLKVLPGGQYDFCILGSRFSLKQTLKLGEFYADRRRVDIRIGGLNISVPTMFCVYNPANLPHLRIYLDKQNSRMYN